MKLFFSVIVPVYDRPDEVGELLESLGAQTYSEPFEIVVVEDGSTVASESVIETFSNALEASKSISRPKLEISYLKKPNSGPGSSRNYGMARAKGDYFIILDSDCILPPRYLDIVAGALRKDFVHCYGGPDAAHKSFSLIQKAINYAMTAVLTTGGIRGGRRVGKKPTAVSSESPSHVPSPQSKRTFQPRSFNMGLSRLAFESTGGFGSIHPGEDPDLVFRLWGQGYTTSLISEAFVFHKRRVDWKKFYVQVNKFGMVRPILSRRYPKTSKMTYWFPTLFCLGFLIASVFWWWGIVLPIALYAFYFILIFIDSFLKNRSLAIALLSIVAVVIQFVGYGFGFLKSVILINFSGKTPEELFPRLFFKNPDSRTSV